MAEKPVNTEQKYLDLIVNKINVCKAYKPKFGQGSAVSFEEFQQLYGNDPFYSWFGLDNPLMYAAHKAAGGITSLYRQIGIGCEQLFRQVIRDQLGLSVAEAKWSYTIKSAKGKDRTLSLDGRIEIPAVRDPGNRQRVEAWLSTATSEMGTDRAIAEALKGAVFEVRQGYKSKDSKRQNADLGNAGTAYQHAYLPVVTVLSTQIDGDVAERYASAGWLLLTGHIGDSPTSSTYAFCDQVLGYDLAGFLQRNSELLKNTVDEVLEALLTPDDQPEQSTGAISADELDVADEVEDVVDASELENGNESQG